MQLPHLTSTGVRAQGIAEGRVVVVHGLTDAVTKAGCFLQVVFFLLLLLVFLLDLLFFSVCLSLYIFSMFPHHHHPSLSIVKHQSSIVKHQ